MAEASENPEQEAQSSDGWSRRQWINAGSAALGVSALLVTQQSASAQEQKNTAKSEGDHSISDPGQKNQLLRDQNPDVNLPPATDHGALGPFWYSFELSRKRVQEGGWTHEVTERELPLSKDLAGVNMRLTKGAFRELHWHTANEWAMMLYGSARISVLNPDGTIFIDDVKKGQLWYFPSGYPHSIQGLGPDGCEFLLVFDEGSFSEDNTFLLSEWIAHTPPEVLGKNTGLNRTELKQLPKQELYIFPADLPQSLAQDRQSVGGKAAASGIHYTFDMGSMAPTKQTSGGQVRVVDSRNFSASKTIAAGLVTIAPGGIRELHWHPNASEWQFWIAGKGRMTVFMPPGRARTMDFRANDVGIVPISAGHYIENTGDTDLVFLEMFKTGEFLDFSLNNWIRHLPPEMVTAHLNLTRESVQKMPSGKQELIKT